MPRMLRMMALAALVMGLASCYPGRFDDQDDSVYDTVITVPSPTAEFEPLRTYSLVDSIVHVDPGDLGRDDLTRAYDQLILDRIRSNMNDLGWTEIVDPSLANLPDVALVVYATTTDYVGIINNPWCWWSWYPYCWGWYYPSYIYTFTVGSVGISMMDVKNPDMENERLNVLWTGVLNGPLDISSPAEAQARLRDGIDQAFDQWSRP